jgi:hypothetical protein
MSAKTPGSGRKPGTPNKRSMKLMEKAQALNIDPFEILLYLAAGDWKSLGYKSEMMIKYTKDTQNEEFTIDPAVRARAAGEACSYLHAKRKSIEAEVPVKTDRPLEHLSDEDLLAIPIVTEED